MAQGAGKNGLIGLTLNAIGLAHDKKKTVYSLLVVGNSQYVIDGFMLHVCSGFKKNKKYITIRRSNKKSTNRN